MARTQSRRIPPTGESEGGETQSRSSSKEDLRQGYARLAFADTWEKTTSRAVCYLITVYILHRRNTDMDLRDSISKPFKKLKHRLSKGSRKRKEGSGGEDIGDGREHDTEGRETDQSFHLPHPETGNVAETGLSQEKGEDNSKEVVQVDLPTPTPSISHTDNCRRTKSLQFHHSLFI